MTFCAKLQMDMIVMAGRSAVLKTNLDARRPMRAIALPESPASR